MNALTATVVRGATPFVLLVAAVFACQSPATKRDLGSGSKPSSDSDGGTQSPRTQGTELYERLLAEIRGIQRVSEEGLKRLGTTWDAELARSRARFAAAATRDQTFYAMLSLQRSYHDGHGNLKALAQSERRR